MTRSLAAVPTPGDPSVIEVLLPRLSAALDGSGPAILPVPMSAAEAGGAAGDGDEAGAVRTALLGTLHPEDLDFPLESDDIAVCLATSGSSGVPKGVLTSRAAMTWAAQALHSHLGGPGQWLLALPAWHIGGLQVLTRSIHAGTLPVAMDLSRPFTARAFSEATDTVRERAAGGRTYASIVPTQLARLLEDQEATEALATYDAVLVGAAATSTALAERARRAGARVLLSYGMSETTGGCAYDGRPLEGLEIKVRAADDRVLVRGPSLFDGYRLRPDLTAAALVGGWLVTNDVGRWSGGVSDAGGRLEVLGRADDMIITGGENVSPLAVAEALRMRPDVADAAVVGVPDAEWGQAVVAYVVPTLPGAFDEDAAQGHVRETLGRAAVPRLILVGYVLPMLASGKVDRSALTALAAAEMRG